MSSRNGFFGRLPMRTRHVLGLDLPQYEPALAVADEGPGTWFAACIYSWLMMVAALLSSAVFIGEIHFVAVIGFLLVVSFPVTHHVHYTRISRVGLSWAVFAAAVVTGTLLFWPRVVWVVTLQTDDVGDAMRLLVEGFLWVMAWRAFSIRTLTEQVQTILPASSIVLVSLVSAVHWSGLLAMAMLILGALALLALERRRIERHRQAPVGPLTYSRAARQNSGLYSWPALYVVALLAALGVGFWAARNELSTGATDYVRMYLAQAIARHFISGIWDHTPPAALWTPRLQPPSGRQIIMQVVCERPTNWRTAAYPSYNGKSWTRRPPRRLLLSRGGSFQIPVEGSGISQASVATEQTITPRVSFGSELPVAFYPVEVDIRDRGMRWDPDGTVASATMATTNQTYRVVSMVPPITVSSTGVIHPLTDEQREANTQLPEGLSPRIGQLARELTAGDDTPFARSRTIEQHLAAGGEYQYDLRAPSPWPDELVEGFLFNTKRGYCYHFASAMVLMCRAIDIPARLAVGYTRGETRGDELDLYIVRSEDAHAWPEVYIDDLGWTAFEPTPGMGDDEARTFEDVWDGTTAQARQWLATVRGYVRAYWPPALIAVMLLAASAVGTRSYLDRMANRPPPNGGSERRMVWAYRRMRALLAAHGMPDRPQTPAGEYLRSVPPHLAPLRPHIERLIDLYTSARFSRAPATDAQTEQAIEALTHLRMALVRLRPSAHLEPPHQDEVMRDDTPH